MGAGTQGFGAVIPNFAPGRSPGYGARFVRVAAFG